MLSVSTPQTNDIRFRDATGFAKGKRLPWAAVVEHAREVIDGFAKLGLTPHPQSRVARYVELLDHPPPIDERSVDISLYPFLHYRIDVRMLRTILRQLGDNQEFRPLLSELLSGPQLRQRREKSSVRDLQFQLYLAAVLHRAGLTVVNEEPDIGVNIGCRRFAIAVKRVRSPKKLLVRVKEGIEQIRRSGRQGWVALDLTLLAAEPDVVPVNESSLVLRRIPELYLQSNAHEIKRMTELLDGVDIVGVQLCFFVAGLSVQSDGISGLSTSFSIFPYWAVSRSGPTWNIVKSIDAALMDNSGPT